MALDGVLHLNIQDCAYTAATFNQFIDVLLDNMNPFPEKNSVIIMDNASIHKSPQLQAMIEERYVIISMFCLHLSEWFFEEEWGCFTYPHILLTSTQ